MDAAFSSLQFKAGVDFEQTCCNSQAQQTQAMAAELSALPA